MPQEVISRATNYFQRIAMAFVLASGFGGTVIAKAQEQLILNKGQPSETSIPLQSGSIVTIDPLTGNILAIPADPIVCSGDCTASVDVNTFTVPADINQGESFTTSLSSLGSRECQRSGLPGSTWNQDWALPIGGSLVVTLNADIVPDTYTLIHECRNGDIFESASATLVVNEGNIEEPPPPAECDEFMRPAGWTRDTAVLGLTSTLTFSWRDFFGVEFPAANGRNMIIGRDQYAALSFTPGQISASGQLNFTELSNSFSDRVGFGPTVVSISACPGDFRKDILDKCMVEDAAQTNAFRWTTDPDPADTSLCVLPDAETLYLNVSYRDDFGRWSCSSDTFGDEFDECGNFVND